MKPGRLPAHTRVRLVRLVALLFLPLAVVAVASAITLPRRMNELAVDSARERARGLAEVLASLVAADLEFDDREHARVALEQIGVEPDLEYSALYSGDGALFASSRGTAAPERDALTPGRLARARVWVDGGHMHAEAPVAAPGGTQGRLFLAFSTAALDARCAANNRTAALVGAVVALIGLLFSLATATFIVRRQMAEEALRRSAERFEALSDILPVALIIHREDRIFYANPAAWKILAGGAGGQESDLSAYLAPGQQLPATGDGSRGHLEELSVTLRDGRTLRVEATSLQFAFGEAEAAALVMFDVTERKQLQERVLLSDRMASLGTLAAGVAHEINNPLSVVMSNVELARDFMIPLVDHALPDPDDHALGVDTRDSLTEALEAANRVRRIVANMKSLSRGDDEQLGPVDINGVLTTSLQMVHGHIKHRAIVVEELGDVPDVLGNESRLVQVFVNLLVNAAQALPDGRASDNKITVETRRDGDMVLVAVRDTGCGIPAAARARIFDPFFTTKAIGVGTGLGLAIVHNLVTAMDGRIEVESQEGVGTTFTVRLVPTAEARREVIHTALIPIDRRARVLVIDDEPAVGDVITRLLADVHDVTALVSARVALERLDAGDDYDLILCDLRMPDMSGTELATRLVEQHPAMSTRLVFMTGDVGDASAAATSPIPVLEKPFSRARLTSFVNSHLVAPQP